MNYLKYQITGLIVTVSTKPYGSICREKNRVLFDFADLDVWYNGKKSTYLSPRRCACLGSVPREHPDGVEGIGIILAHTADTEIVNNRVKQSGGCCEDKRMESENRTIRKSAESKMRCEG
jgi:hypothetical protein